MERAEKEYFAFISYKSEDTEWAIWVQHELEHYHLPTSYNGRTDVRQELRPVFRDMDELSAGNLPEQIKQALEDSQNLIVICSPQAASSPWVNQEVKTFISLGRTDRIFPFVVEGDSPKEFFPPALLNLPRSEERLGGNVSKNGRDAAFVKVVAGMLGVGFDSLWNRYEKEKAEEERKIREQRDHLLKIQSKFLAEKALSLITDGDHFTARAILLDALPINLDNPSRPYVPKTEFALRKAMQYQGAKISHTNKVSYSVFSPDGSKLVSACEDHNVYIWDLLTGTQINKLYGHTGIVNSANYSTDGKLIVSASEDWTIRIWDSKNGDCIRVMHLPGYRVNYANFSPDGKRIVSASIDKKGRVWDADNGKCILLLEGHSAEINFAEFNHAGDRIITVSKDHTIRIWDAISGSCQLVIDGHDDIVNTGTFSLDDKQVLSASNDGATIIWDSYTGEQVRKFKNGDAVSSAVFSPDGRSILTVSSDFAGKAVFLREIKSGEINQRFQGHDYYIRFASFNQGGNQIVTASMDKTIRIWDVYKGNCIGTEFGQHLIQSDISEDGCYKVCVSEKNTVQVWNTYSNKDLVEEWGVPDDYIESVSFGNGSKHVLAFCRNLIGYKNNVTSSFSTPIFSDCIRCWGFEPLKDILTKMRTHYVIKHLSGEEMQKYYLD